MNRFAVYPYEPAPQEAVEEKAEPMLELHFITCPCERCQAVREERKHAHD